ncbi:hypothetical protein ACA910_003707 [Epithemia clementina (nom. ined.)]
MSSSTTVTATTSSGATTLLASVRVVPNEKLYVSEPDPDRFGNGPNPANDPSWTNGNWLNSRFHFSFVEYNNPRNPKFGVMRVMNDDLVQPHRSFGTHPHVNMEIVSYIVEGELTHQDSMGNKESLGRGSSQFMTAGTGVRHSKFNHGDKPLRFIQTWIVPSHIGLRPNYGSFAAQKSTEKQCINEIKHLVGNVKDTSGKSSKAPVHINQDVDGYAAEMELGQTLMHKLRVGRQAYLLCMEGSVKVNGQVLKRHDACEIQGDSKVPTTVEIEASGMEATENGDLAHILMFTMKQVPGSGRGDL